MIKIFFAAFVLIFSTATMAQNTTRDELEKQKQQLKKQLEQTEKMLNDNKSKSKETYATWKITNDKVTLQNRIIENINQDIDLLDNSLVKTQRDINRYDKILDTLKQEYAKSMVYAYKNRSNYDFLNFIFSSGSFNDAIKRLAYLKSYRNYREMQGQNILRTQELRRQRKDELSTTKQKKNLVLQDKDKEMATLEKQKLEKDRILNELKKKGKELNNQMSATKKQLKKVDNAIAAAIKRAIDDARKIAAKKAAEETKKAAAEKATAKANAKANTNITAAPEKSKESTTPKKIEPKKDASVLLNAENTVLNANFINNRGALPWPVDKGYILMHFGSNTLESKTIIISTGIQIATDIGISVKAVFDGTVIAVVNIDDMQAVIMQHGKYFTTYSNLSNVSVQRGQTIQRGQAIGKVAANLDGIGTVDFNISDERNNLDPERWLRKR